MPADTAGAAEMVADWNNPEECAIASSLAAEVFGLDAAALPAPAAGKRSSLNPFATRAGVAATIAALCTAAIGIAAAMLPGRTIAPITRPDPSV